MRRRHGIADSRLLLRRLRVTRTWLLERHPEIKLQCSCGYVTTRVLLNPLMTRILAYRCDGCQKQRRDVGGEFSEVRS